MKQIRIGEAFVFAFDTIKKFPMLLLAPPILLSLIINGIDYFIPTDLVLRQTFFKKMTESIISKLPASVLTILGILAFFLFVILLILFLSLEIGRIRIVINIYNQSLEEPAWNMYNNFGNGIIGKYFWASILVGLVVLFGFLLLIIPGFIFSIMYMFVLFIIVDQDLSISESFKLSKELTEGIKWNLFGFMLLSALIQMGILIPISLLNQVGLNFLYLPMNTVVTPIVGIFFTVASLYIYKDIREQAENLDQLIHKNEKSEEITKPDKGEEG